MKTFGHLKAKASSQKGYSLIEISIVLAITAVILIGALMGSRQVMLSSSVNAQVRETATVISKLQRQYIKQTDTSAATVNSLAPLGIWPSERVSKSGSGTSTTYSVRGAISGTTEFVFGNSEDIGSLSAKSGFVYTIRNVPKDACPELLTALDSLAMAIYAGKLTANPTGAKPTTTAVKEPEASQVSLTSLGTACNPAAENVVDVSLVIR